MQRRTGNFGATLPRESSEMSSNAEATSAYVAAMQAISDASRDAALTNLARATDLDPNFAAAHLRFVATAPTADDDVREHARLAFSRRNQLSAHDRALLDAYLPWTGVPQDTAGTERALTAAVRAEPNDADYAHNLCRVRMALGEYRKGVEACEAAIRIDPGFADAYRYKGYNLLLAGDAALAKAEYETCLAVSPAATSCLRDLNELEFGAGHCETAVGLARRLIALDPKQPVWSRLLGFGLFGMGASPESVRLSLEQSWQLRSPARRPRYEWSDRVGLAIATGQFDEAEKDLMTFRTVIESIAEEDLHLEAADRLINLYLEQGRNAEAIHTADAYARQRSAWTPVAHFDAGIAVAIWKYRAGALSRDAFRALRDKWLASERLRSVTLGQFGGASGFRWILAYADPAMTADDGKEAIAALPSYLPLPNRFLRLEAEEAIGRVYLLAGRHSEAIEHLGSAANACSGAKFPFGAPVAWYELGVALETTGDKDAACDAYRRVIARWPCETSRSRTSVHARQALRSLGCERPDAVSGRSLSK